MSANECYRHLGTHGPITGNGKPQQDVTHCYCYPYCYREDTLPGSDILVLGPVKVRVRLRF